MRRGVDGMRSAPSSGAAGAVVPASARACRPRSASRIRDEILHPAASVAFGYQPVKLITKQRGVATGLLKNEDNFSVQVLKTDGAWALVPRESVAEMRREPATLMPDGFESKLDAQQLQNLLAYLDRQRAPATAVEIRPVAY